MAPTTPPLEARVRPHEDRGSRRTKLVAFVELTIGGAFVIKGIRILKRDEPGDDELFVVFPAERGKGASADRWYDVAHPCTIEARNEAIRVILAAYARAQEAAA